MAAKDAGAAIQSTSLGLETELAGRVAIEAFPLSFGEAEVIKGKDSLWVVVDVAGRGGCAIRAGYLLGNEIVSVKKIGDRRYELSYSAGTVRVDISESDACLRVRTWIIPHEDLIVPYVPRDFYLVDGEGDPTKTKGRVHTSQAGVAAPVVYLTLTEPKTGSFLYFQNLTALNPYFDLTGTSPEGCVGGNWPEFGYLPPTSTEKGLPGKRETLISDAIIAFDKRSPVQPKAMSDLFIELLARLYPLLERTKTERREWQELAVCSLRDLNDAPGGSVEHWNCKYLRPYNEAEYPDCMVQANVIHGLRDYERWSGEEVPLAKDLEKGLGRFYDADLKTMRRYLSNVGKDKNADEVDSWYMYHPLMSLARLARGGNEGASKLLFDSLDTAMRFAKKFKYRWPVLFDLKTGKVIREERREGEPGQSDVAGLYAYLMMQVYEITGKTQYVNEARRAMDAVKDLSFELAYQLNTTAWGVTAGVRIWKETGEESYLRQAIVFFAAFIRHTIFWESEINLAKHFSTFLAVLCLDDTRYMAQFECHESFEAFWEALSLGGEKLPEPVRLLMAEYCKYALHRAWFYYPKFLPDEAVAKEIRNGTIDRKLHFPLEDLYPAGQLSGQVGQEIYGSGAAFAFTTNAFHHLGDAPFILYCEYPIRNLEIGEGLAGFEIVGSPRGSCSLEILAKGKGQLKATITADGKASSIKTGEPFELTGNRYVTLEW